MFTFSYSVYVYFAYCTFCIFCCGNWILICSLKCMTILAHYWVLLVSLLRRAYFNCLTGGTIVPPVKHFVPQVKLVGRQLSHQWGPAFLQERKIQCMEIYVGGAHSHIREARLHLSHMPKVLQISPASSPGIIVIKPLTSAFMRGRGSRGCFWDFVEQIVANKVEWFIILNVRDWQECCTNTISLIIHFNVNFWYKQQNGWQKW